MYFSGRRRDSMRIIESDDTITTEVNFGAPVKGSVLYSKCMQTAKNGICIKNLNYYKLFVGCHGDRLRFNYFMTYDYVNDSLGFQMPVWGNGVIALNDLRNPNAPTYIGNYTLNNKTYTHVHKLEFSTTYGVEAYVNDSVGLIYYNYGGVYITELF